MLVTPAGSVMLVRPKQPENAESPMLVTPSGIVMPVRPLEYKNASLPMLVTAFPLIVAGISTSPPVPV